MHVHRPHRNKKNVPLTPSRGPDPPSSHAFTNGRPSHGLHRPEASARPLTPVLLHASDPTPTMTFLNFLIAFGLAILAVLATLHLLYRLAAAINSHVLEYYARVAGSFVALFLCAAYGTVASAILNVVGYGGLGQWTTARSFKYAMLLFTGAWFEITDPHDWLNTTRPAVFIGNHQSELDVFLLGHIFPKYCSVTAKKSLKYWPFLGWFSRCTSPHSLRHVG